MGQWDELEKMLGTGQDGVGDDLSVGTCDSCGGSIGGDPTDACQCAPGELPKAEKALADDAIDLAKRREDLLLLLQQNDEQLERVLSAIGVGKMFQDPTNKVVYKVVEPSGKFIKFKKIDYVRTRKTLEEKADLAMSEAQAAGFDLGALGPKRKG